MSLPTAAAVRRGGSCVGMLPRTVGVLPGDEWKNLWNTWTTRSPMSGIGSCPRGSVESLDEGGVKSRVWWMAAGRLAPSSCRIVHPIWRRGGRRIRHPQFPYLFSPLRLGSTVVPNRIVFSAHLTNLRWGPQTSRP